MRLANLLKRKFSNKFSKHPFISNSKIQRISQISGLATIRNSRIQGYVTVGENSKILDVTINGKVNIGRWSIINGPSEIYALINSVEIGCFCSIARNVIIQEYNHVSDHCTTYFIHRNFFKKSIKEDMVSKGKIVIGNDVWIGTSCVILGGAKISDGVIIGANSVVNSTIPPYAIAAGSPAQVVKYRFESAIIKQLLRLHWWDWSDDRINRNQLLFDGILSQEKIDNIV